MNIKSLGVSVILLSLIFTQDIFSQIVFEESGYSVIDCSGMPAGAVKTAAELAASKQSVADGGRVLRHIQYTNQQGTHITGTYGTDALYINQKVSRKFAVAKSDAMAAMTWATASGWASGANREISGDSKPANTGCAVYQGKDNADPKGSWRLPIQRELMVIYSLKGQLAKTAGFTAFSSSNYWNATEVNGSGSWCVSFGYGNVNGSNKISSLGVRCVRDL